jgi:hypothetical protein
MNLAHAREAVGELSADERARLPSGRTAAILEARDHYELMLLLARRAREDLNRALGSGLPRREVAVANHHRTAYRLINAFVWANCSLWRAAAEVCRIERLKDEGVAEGITWDIAL